MNIRKFEELLRSVREGGAILRGRKKPSRRIRRYVSVAKEDAGNTRR